MPFKLRRLILEYLGGIETEIQKIDITKGGLILEYLGGIETLFFCTCIITVIYDFRIPRRD